MSEKALKISAIVIGVLLLLPTAGIFWAYTNQEKIINKAIDAAESSINGKLEIGGFKFKPFGRNPGLTFSFSDIKLTDSLFHKHEKPFCEIKRLDVTFGIETLLNFKISIKNILIEDGSVFIFVRRDSYSNHSIFSSSDTTNKDQSANKNPFKKIKSLRFHNLKLTYADSLQEKFYGAVFQQVTGAYQRNNQGWFATLQGPTHVEKLVFNSEKGAFLKDRPIHLFTSVKFSNKDKNLIILPDTYIQLETLERIGISGNIQTGGKGKPLNLDFHTYSIRVPLATSLLADSIASKIDKIGIDTHVSANVSLRGKTGEKQPWVRVQFKTDTFSYHTPVGTFRNIKSDGEFDNRIDSLHRPGNANSQIKSGRISGYFEKVPVKGNLQLTDLSDPTAKIVLHATMDTTGMNSLLDTERYYATKGKIGLDLSFNGKLRNLYDSTSDKIRGRLLGKVRINDMAITYLPRDIKLDKIDCNVSVSEENLTIHKLDFSDHQNILHIRGNLYRYLHLLLGSSTHAKAKIDIHIPKWKLNWIEFLVGEKSQRKDNSSKKFSRLIDQLIGQTEIDASLKAGQLTYFNLKANNVDGHLTMKNNVMTINSLDLDAFGGKVAIKGTLESPGHTTKYAKLNASGNIKKADVKNILYSFNDFGQKALSSKNVNGQLDLIFRISTHVNPNVSLVPQSMNGFLDLNFQNGQLINFEPFLKIKKIVFKNRPLENVKIAPINKRFELKGQEIKIDKMQIKTNVLTLFLEGQYSFGDKTDLVIQFPLKNLKKREEGDEFRNYDEDLRSIYLRAVQEENGVNIKLDSRKKARKRNSSDSTDSGG